MSPAVTLHFFSFNDSHRIRSGRARWRLWIACYVIAALVLPALGPLPWMLTGVGGASHIVAAEPHEHGSAAHVHHDHHDRSDVPGSPTHPSDHNCLACQVLAQLGRCCAWWSPPAVEAAVVPCLLAILFAEAPLRLASRFALTPPARAPPTHRV